ncbi:MAG: isoprenylcysteine carboxylmethyltransferase family protein [bacterium]|nr:isoprenylcysteine carboxylmethyltransferase family protein [bacterium]MDT8395336.1 isoprenylcysteine carboxylmethyltransferase family protein [bacterium]
MNSDYAYGHWSLVIGSVLLVFFFVSRYIPIRTRLEKRSGGMLATFIVALFTEMYGFPLTIYFLSSRFGIEIPLTHKYGHLLAYLLTYIGLDILYGWALVMIVSNVMIVIGIIWISRGWEQVYSSDGELVTTGIYARMRHPQYSGIILAATGFLIQWPTLLTLILFPFVVVMYHRLATREEKDVEEKFKDEYRDYRGRVPAFVPRMTFAHR